MSGARAPQALVSVGVLAAVLLAPACASGPGRPVQVHVLAEGLPPNVTPRIAAVRRSLLRGYYADASLPVFRLREGNVSVPAGSTLDGGIVETEDEATRYVPAPRFQPVPGDGGPVTFAYHVEYLVTVSRGAQGVPCSPGTTAGGTTSVQSEWVKPGTRLSIRANPHPGWRLAHWGVFSPGETVNETTASGTSNPLTLTVNAPVDVNASFVPAC